MQVSDLFLLPDGRLRAGWRLLLFIIVFVAALFAVSLLISFTGQVPSVTLQMLITAGATGLATWLMLRWMEGAPFASVGLEWLPGSGSELARGLGVGIGAVWVVTAIELGIGAIRFESRGGGQSSSAPGSAFVVVLMLFGLLGVGAAAEEVLFRGYPFQRVAEGTNGTVAVLVTSGIFGWLHGSNPYATDLSLINTVLAGVLLGLACVRTGALWWPIGFHFAWNWMLAVIGYPVSGLDVAQLPWGVVAVSEPAWVHGGSYGPEGGAVASGVLVACIAGVFVLQPSRSAPAIERRAD
jgi:uncharacterized protein